MFTSQEMQAFAADYGFKIIHSSPYYAMLKLMDRLRLLIKYLKNVLRKMVTDNPITWHRVLSEVIWAYRTTCKSQTGTTPFALTYRHDALLPAERVVPSLRVALLHQLTP